MLSPTHVIDHVHIFLPHLKSLLAMIRFSHADLRMLLLIGVYAKLVARQLSHDGNRLTVDEVYDNEVKAA